MRFNKAAQQFRGVFRHASAQMEWSARVDDFEFQSDRLACSTTDAAQLGWERNGSFYRHDEDDDDDDGRSDD